MIRPTRPAALFALFVAATFAGCADTEVPDEGDAEPFVEHDENADFVEAADDGKSDQVSATFNQHFIMSDEFFVDTDSVNAEALQIFFENSPYRNRSWMADQTFEGKRAADVIVEHARQDGVNPIVLLARMQVEQGLVSKTVAPSRHRIDRAFGCGCPDSSGCQNQYLGFGNQIDCAANTMTKLYNASVDGSGGWRRSTTKQSLDGYSVRPQTHATAAMYAYTPWVLPRRGGNWLVWNVTKKYLNHFVELGLFDLPEPSWVGSVCEGAESCDFTSDGKPGFCLEHGANFENGFCSLPCEGYCPDRTGFATTFCVDVGGQGLCVSKAHSLNDNCSALPGTIAQQASRFIGSSSAPASTATVCMPQ